VKVLALTFVLITGCTRCAEATPAVHVDAGPAAFVGAGTPVWFGSAPAIPELNTQVDLGTIRAINDEFEVVLEWPESRMFATERVVCTGRGALHFEISSRVIDADGGVLRVREYDPASARAKAEQAFAESGPGSFGSDPRSLVCWAVARKCDGQPISWPPPPNLTPLEYSERADRMRAEYNARFIPGCRLR
jgi:hypothetical protein